MSFDSASQPKNVWKASVIMVLEGYFTVRELSRATRFHDAPTFLEGIRECTSKRTQELVEKLGEWHDFVTFFQAASRRRPVLALTLVDKLNIVLGIETPHLVDCYYINDNFRDRIFDHLKKGKIPADQYNYLPAFYRNAIDDLGLTYDANVIQNKGPSKVPIMIRDWIEDVDYPMIRVSKGQKGFAPLPLDQMFPSTEGDDEQEELEKFEPYKSHTAEERLTYALGGFVLNAKELAMRWFSQFRSLTEVQLEKVLRTGQEEDFHTIKTLDSSYVLAVQTGTLNVDLLLQNFEELTGYKKSRDDVITVWNRTIKKIGISVPQLTFPLPPPIPVLVPMSFHVPTVSEVQQHSGKIFFSQNLPPLQLVDIPREKKKYSSRINEKTGKKSAFFIVQDPGNEAGKKRQFDNRDTILREMSPPFGSFAKGCRPVGWQDHFQQVSQSDHVWELEFLCSLYYMPDPLPIELQCILLHEFTARENYSNVIISEGTYIPQGKNFSDLELDLVLKNDSLARKYTYGDGVIRFLSLIAHTKEFHFSLSGVYTLFVLFSPQRELRGRLKIHLTHGVPLMRYRQLCMAEDMIVYDHTKTSKIRISGHFEEVRKKVEKYGLLYRLTPFRSMSTFLDYWITFYDDDGLLASRRINFKNSYTPKRITRSDVISVSQGSYVIGTKQVDFKN